MRLFLFSFLFSTAVLAQDFYAISEKSIDGKDFPMKSLSGKVVLIVNVASQCGYTPQLDKLESLYQKYKAKGLVVLGVPTNDFGGQTPEDDKAMLEFCQKKFNVSFPMLTKKTIKGSEKRPLYVYLTDKTPKDLKGEVSWNFEKFLVDKKGVVQKRYKSSADPMELGADIEKYL